MEWVRVKGNLTCDVCKKEMTNIVLPPPPPTPFYVLFADIDHDWRMQCNMFGCVLAHNAMQGMVYLFVVCICLGAPLFIAILGGMSIALFLLLRCLFMLAYNAAVGRSVLQFDAD